MVLFVRIAYGVAILAAIIFTLIYIKFIAKNELDIASKQSRVSDYRTEDNEEQMLRDAIKYFKIVNR